jgi:twitching motility protein PilT
MTIQQLLQLAIDKNASDLHLVVGFPSHIKVHGDLFPIPGEQVLTPSMIESMINNLITGEQKALFIQNWELDFSYDFEGKGRFRINLYKQKGHPAIALRLIPNNIPDIAQLGLPTVLNRITELKQGFVLVTGPTGHGKSTTLASILNKINQQRSVHILTVEDPIEYVYPVGKAVISQRELFGDTRSWDNALRAALREDPDIVLVGEMRDLETIAAALTIAETGHLVFATLHTNSAPQSIDRIIDVFPENQQGQIRMQIAQTFEAIISQRLVPTITPGRVAANEILFATGACRNMIREGKTFMIDNLIQTSGELGMQSFESSLAGHVKSGKISADVAMKYALKPDLLAKLLRN